MSKVLATEESQEEGKVVSREEPQSKMSTVLPTEQPQDQAAKVLPKEKPTTGKKGLMQILGLKKNKKKGKKDMKSVFPAMPMIEEVASPSMVAEEPIARAEPIINEGPTPKVNETTKADDQVSRFEIVVSFNASKCQWLH